MWIYSLLLPLCLLGAVAAQPFYFDGGHHHPRGFAALDDSEAVVKTFLEKMTKTIETKDSRAIAELFAENFFFKGCKGDYDKNKIVALIGKLPAGTAFSFTFKSAKYLSADKIDYSVIISGFGPTPVEAQFLLCAKIEKLSGGSVPACKRSHFHGLVAQQSAKEMVEKFVSRMIRSIESKDVSIISGLFQPSFRFEGCKGTYTKAKIVTLLLQLPAGTKFSIVIKYVRDLGDKIDYVVSANGFGPSEIVAEFVLSKKDQQLVNGYISSCEVSHSLALRDDGHIGRSFSAQDNTRVSFQQSDAEAVVMSFLRKLVAGLEERDAEQIGNLFGDDFIFNGCKGTYNKQRVVGLLTQLPMGVEFHIELLSSKFVATDLIEYTVTVSGFGASPLTAQFTLNATYKKLQGGFIPACQKSRFHALVPLRSSFAGARPPRSLVKDTTDIITEMLVILKQTIAKHDSSALGQLFDDNFVFKGCRGTYNKAETLAKINQVPKEANFNFALKSANWNNLGQIEYTVTISGALLDDFDAQFVYCPYRQVLKSGNIPSCPAKRMFNEDEPCLFGLFCF
ncbi:unnamed protein product [Caenorhabditis brenneri]